jgi:hypothetical protein
MSALRYDNPQALRQALSDRLRPLAEKSGMELSALLRQFAYDRLLCRVFSAEPERWVLKGATAQLRPSGSLSRCSASRSEGPTPRRRRTCGWIAPRAWPVPAQPPRSARIRTRASQSS